MPLQATGSEALIVFDEEVTYNTIPTAAAANPRLFPFTSEDLRRSRGRIESAAITAYRDRRMPRQENIDVRGTINFEADATWMGTIFKHALGSVSSTTTAPNYTHTITVGALPTGLMLEKRFINVGSATGTQYFNYRGCKINQLSMSFSASGFITGSVSVIGASENQSTASYTTATATDLGNNPFDGFEATIFEGGTGGTTLGYATDIEFTLDNALDDTTFAIGGAGTRRNLPEGFSTITGTMTVLFEDISLYTKAVNFDTSLIKIQLTRGTGDGSAGNEHMEILIPELKYDSSAPVVADDRGIKLELPFSAFASTAGGSTTSMQITLKNTQATI
ncbi:MAG: phage tail tube protein [bacterium]